MVHSATFFCCIDADGSRESHEMTRRGVPDVQHDAAVSRFLFGLYVVYMGVVCCVGLGE